MQATKILDSWLDKGLTDFHKTQPVPAYTDILIVLLHEVACMKIFVNSVYIHYTCTVYTVIYEVMLMYSIIQYGM